MKENYFHFSAEMLVGCEVVSVSAMTSHVDLTLPPPDNISSVFHLENGCSGVFVMVVSSRSPKVSFYGTDGQNKSSFFPFSGVTEELKAFINDVSENTLKGAKDVAVLEAMLESGAKRQ
ncbi:uncharacterized protein LOC114388053 [Glycine soja]|uniref:uncharacterized protein LOC114388053 n=1 Tax=Glycine soja TaxID=3848 RepID=UPI00103F3AD1|nr:uncharacterized protein LOC114388053 [Glycine soja]